MNSGKCDTINRQPFVMTILFTFSFNLTASINLSASNSKAFFFSRFFLTKLINKISMTKVNKKNITLLNTLLTIFKMEKSLHFMLKLVETNKNCEQYSISYALNGNFFSKILKTSFFRYSNILNELKQLGISKKIIAITTDYCADIKVLNILFRNVLL